MRVVAQLHLVEERHSSAFERERSVSRGATPATDAEADEGAGGERGKQEVSPASPASPASIPVGPAGEARARIVSSPNRINQLK